MLKRLLHLIERKRPLSAQEVLEVGLSLEPSARDLTRLYPVIIPVEADEAGWPGPTIGMGDLPFCVAWATCGDMNTFFYVTDREAAFWESEHLDWRSIAMSNLAAASEERPASGEKLDENGVPFVKVMLHEDALGPSRLLLPRLFERELGSDYEVAIPERTCAIAFRAGLTGNEASDIAGMIDGCFNHGTEPLSQERYKACSFWGYAGAT